MKGNYNVPWILIDPNGKSVTFDHDPFERLKKIISNYDSSDLQVEAGKIVFEMWQAISETVSEIGGKNDMPKM